jgi:hypothetical protein
MPFEAFQRLDSDGKKEARINKAFRGKVIADPKHEIIEALRGKV